MRVYILDGIRYKEKEREKTIVENKKDGQQRNETNINLPVELAETIKELNDDTVEYGTRMSKIDLKARLSMVETSAILAYDTLVELKFIPKDTLFLTRQRKRLSVSEEGKGRTEIVQIVQGKNEHDEKLNDSGMKKVGFMQGKK
jgi:hypothetical protein